MIFFEEKFPHRQLMNKEENSINICLEKEKNPISYILISENIEKKHYLAKVDTNFEVFRSFGKPIEKTEKFTDNAVVIAVKDNKEIWRKELGHRLLNQLKSARSGGWILRDLFHKEDYPKNEPIEVLDANSLEFIKGVKYSLTQDIKIKDLIIPKGTIVNVGIERFLKEYDKQLLPLNNIISVYIKDEEFKLSLTLPSNLIERIKEDS